MKYFCRSRSCGQSKVLVESWRAFLVINLGMRRSSVRLRFWLRRGTSRTSICPGRPIVSILADVRGSVLVDVDDRTTIFITPNGVSRILRSQPQLIVARVPLQPQKQMSILQPQYCEKLKSYDLQVWVGGLELNQKISRQDKPHNLSHQFLKNYHGFDLRHNRKGRFTIYYEQFK